MYIVRFLRLSKATSASESRSERSARLLRSNDGVVETDATGRSMKVVGDKNPHALRRKAA